MQCLGILSRADSQRGLQQSLPEDVFNMNHTESPVSDNFAVIPDSEQCAELIVKHCRRGGRGINAASEKPLSLSLSGNRRY